jgi:hypothetical protein
MRHRGESARRQLGQSEASPRRASIKVSLDVAGRGGGRGGGEGGRWRKGAEEG